MYENKISYTELSEAYIQVLEKRRQQANSIESCFSESLSHIISKPEDKDDAFFQSKAYVLLKSWTTDAFHKQYLSKRTEKFIDKIDKSISRNQMVSEWVK